MCSNAQRRALEALFVVASSAHGEDVDQSKAARATREFGVPLFLCSVLFLLESLFLDSLVPGMTHRLSILVRIAQSTRT